MASFYDEETGNFRGNCVPGSTPPEGQGYTANDPSPNWDGLNGCLVLNAGDFIQPRVLVGTTGTAKLTDLEFLVMKLNNY